VGISYYGWNPHAGRLYERLGFKEEGREREMLWMAGKRWDKVRMGILEREWTARKEKKEKQENN
jgi:RimJ/RimL family protein N-acetyltransferase